MSEDAEPRTARGVAFWDVFTGNTKGTPHDHTEYVEGCFRCDLSRDEADA